MRKDGKRAVALGVLSFSISPTCVHVATFRCSPTLETSVKINTFIQPVRPVSCGSEDLREVDED